ncbi:hypothetical protein [Alkalibacterium sp. AK22]|uniref:hypothetical protein n=1 Tax=Alkalibacterium sp. AK22 TaxID=1229520 RepID=UPI0012DDFBF6|nr:hypothetical protein [Alkalibacterium sp. AK22]
MKRKIIISSAISLILIFMLFLFSSLVNEASLSTSFLALALISVLGMIITEKDKYLFLTTFIMFIFSSIGLIAEIIPSLL